MLRDEGEDVFATLEANSTLSKIPVIVQTKLPDETMSYSLGKVDGSSTSENLQKLLAVLNKCHPDPPEDNALKNGATKNSEDRYSFGPTQYRDVGVNLSM